MGGCSGLICISKGEIGGQNGHTFKSHHHNERNTNHVWKVLRSCICIPFSCCPLSYLFLSQRGVGAESNLHCRKTTIWPSLCTLLPYIDIIIMSINCGDGFTDPRYKRYCSAIYKLILYYNEDTWKRKRKPWSQLRLMSSLVTSWRWELERMKRRDKHGKRRGDGLGLSLLYSWMRLPLCIHQ